MRGGADRDIMQGDQGIDDLHGGNGDDSLYIENADVVRGGAGQDNCVDVLNFANAQTISCEREWEASDDLRNLVLGER